MCVCLVHNIKDVREQDVLSEAIPGSQLVSYMLTEHFMHRVTFCFNWEENGIFNRGGVLFLNII